MSDFSITRRGLLAAPTAVAAATALPSIAHAKGGQEKRGKVALPPAAAAAGMRRLTFNSPFTNLNHIDMKMSGKPGKQWYTRYTWQEWAQQTPSTTLTIRNDDDGSPYLHINPDKSNSNWSIATIDQATGAGTSFTYGYFEVVSRFVTPPVVTDWSLAPNWPAVWLTSARGFHRMKTSYNIEIDILEAYGGPEAWTGTLHSWPGYDPDYADDDQASSPIIDRNHYTDGFSRTFPAGFSESWHKYGMLWTRPDAKGVSTVSWYLDDKLLASMTMGEDVIPVEDDPDEMLAVTPTGGSWQRLTEQPRGTYSDIANEKQVFIIGSGVGNPMDVKSARVWQY